MKRDDFRYVEMAGILRTEILSGYLKPGQFLMTEKELCDAYSISRNSLRQALDLLTKEGLLVRMRGKGNMVSPDVDRKRDGSNTLVIVCPYGSSFARNGLPLLISMFNRQYPNVEVKLFYTQNMNEHMLRDLSGIGVKPDIVLVWDRYFRELRCEEFLALDELVPATDDLPAKVVDAFREKGVCYAVPVTYSPVFLASNQQLLESARFAAPIMQWTTDQFMHAARTLTIDADGDGLSDFYGFGLSSSLIRWPVLAMIHGFGTWSGTSDGFKADGLQQAFAMIQQLMYKDCVSPITAVTDYSFLNELFDDGRIAMMLTTALATNMTQSRFPIKVLPLPQSTEGSAGRLMIANGLMIPQLSVKQHLARRFLECATEIEFQRQMVRSTGFFSIYDRVNSGIWSAYDRHCLGINREDLDQSKWIHELFPQVDKLHGLQNRMKRFWAGMERPEDLVKGLSEYWN